MVSLITQTLCLMLIMLCLIPETSCRPTPASRFNAIYYKPPKANGNHLHHEDNNGADTGAEQGQAEVNEAPHTQIEPEPPGDDAQQQAHHMLKN